VPETEAQYFRQQLEAANVNLLIYPFPAAVASEARVPYVMAIHDLQHRLQPEFPEVSANGEWERREHIFRNGAQGATLLLADSEVGKEDILNCYGKQGVRPDQIKVLPFLPYVKPETSSAERYRVRVRYDLPERYLFYPAQFWPHKNHRRIIQALRVLKDEQEMDVPVVFCGSHTGAIRKRTFKEMMATASQLGLRNNVRYLGYVSDDDISAIYAESSGLVMPTFFGPTNIPVLEAWAAGCPVLTSDIRGIREQVGDAGLLADPRSVESIADGIRRLWTDSELGRTLAQRGRRRLAAYTPANYREALIEAIEEAKLRLRDGSAKWRLKSA
jgi:glycosyltransferase involved in cell wall biosynthesis